MDMKLEVVVVPVSDVDKARDFYFYKALGWRLDADFAAGEEFRVVQLTPPARRARLSSAPGSPQPDRARRRAWIWSSWMSRRPGSSWPGAVSR